MSPSRSAEPSPAQKKETSVRERERERRERREEKTTITSSSCNAPCRSRKSSLPRLLAQACLLDSVFSSSLHPTTRSSSVSLSLFSPLQTFLVKFQPKKTMQQPNSDAAELLSNLLDSVEETVCLATDPEAETLNLTSALPVFAAFVERLAPILHGLPQTEDSATPAIRKAVEALGTELRRARALVRSSAGSPVAVRLMEGCARDLGRCLGLFLDAWGNALDEVKKEEIGGLQREMMGVRFGGSKGREVVDVEDLVVRVKSGDEDELGVVLLELGILITEGLVTEEGVCLIPVLLIRLASAKSDNRLKIILLLRSLAFHSDENKERMAGIEALSSVVKSLSRDVDESRQAVGLLLDLSDVVKVRQRLGRIQGCIVMLVALLNGDDPSASCDARKLLCALSSNSQNVLLMAEAGYFMPLLRYLKEGTPKMLLEILGRGWLL